MGLLLEVPAVKNRITKPLVFQEWAREEDRVKKVKQDVERAREDVATLLEELDRASEKVVDLMTGYAGQAQEAQNKLTPAQEAPSMPRQAQEAASMLTQAQEALSLPRLTSEPIPKRKTQSSKKTVDAKYQSVFELAAQGMQVDDIAKLTKIGKGEVRLLLELKNRGGNQ